MGIFCSEIASGTRGEHPKCSSSKPICVRIFVHHEVRLLLSCMELDLKMHYEESISEPCTGEHGLHCAAKVTGLITDMIEMLEAEAEADATKKQAIG